MRREGTQLQKRKYWLDLFSPQTWEEFLATDQSVSGFRESKWKTVQRIQPGDYLICYLTGVSRFVGMLEVTSEAFVDSTRIWKNETFPARVKVKPVVILSLETAVPIRQLQDRISIFGSEPTSNSWSGHVRGSPTLWKVSDGEAVFEALVSAEENPVHRPVDQRKVRTRLTTIESDKGPVTVPEDDDPPSPPAVATKETSEHTEIQWLLAKLGSDIGFDVWVATNDRNREANGQPINRISRIKDRLPRQFDEVTNRIIEHIDVIWLRGNSYAAAFEIEKSTSIYSGLLRMSDLTVMQPNLKIALYIVAPEDRRDKVYEEITRPTFRIRETPLHTVCRYISFDTLRDQIEKVQPFISYLRADFIESLSDEVPHTGD